MKVLTDERKRHILHVLDRDGMASVQNLCTDMNTSPSTVRRDLADLESEAYSNGSTVAPNVAAGYAMNPPSA